MPGMLAVICQTGDDVAVNALAKADPTFAGPAGLFFVVSTCNICCDQVPHLPQNLAVFGPLTMHLFRRRA